MRFDLREPMGAPPEAQDGRATLPQDDRVTVIPEPRRGSDQNIEADPLSGGLRRAQPSGAGWVPHVACAAPVTLPDISGKILGTAVHRAPVDNLGIVDGSEGGV